MVGHVVCFHAKLLLCTLCDIAISFQNEVQDAGLFRDYFIGRPQKLCDM